MVPSESIVLGIEKSRGKLKYPEVKGIEAFIIAHREANNKCFILWRLPTIKQEVQVVVFLQGNCPGQGEGTIWIFQEPDDPRHFRLLDAAKALVGLAQRLRHPTIPQPV